LRSLWRLSAPQSHRTAIRPVWAAALALLLLLGACSPSAERAPQARPAEGAAQPSSTPVIPPPPAEVGTRPPKVGARSILVLNFDTGAILYAKGAGVHRPIASLTKIMTAMVVLHRTRPKEVVTTSALAANQEPTSLGLRPGDRLDVHNALYALMLHSSNDVAVALAEHVSGSVRAFDSLMTMQGIDIGLTDTWFASPSGLDDDGYSTARDLATLTHWAYGSPEFASIVATRSYPIRLPWGKRVWLRNLNDLLFDYPGTLGVKTGYTSKSHWSLVAVAKRGHVRVLVVLLADPKEPFRDGAALLDWAFAKEYSLSGRNR
jgi:serine-type D-Ala-D-Ala carboxypeptidase (penicillin-binding protein 5/6)